ncbi:MAG: hypothetical protein CFE31_08595 [Rhizobiales bacterium PAR1]|nr:MAG: hypothetical protein CFE31_08595 [Rhizobiales bacterium PAR1]
MCLDRRQMLLATGAAALALPTQWARAQSKPALLTVGSRTLDVHGRSAKVYGISGKGRLGLLLTIPVTGVPPILAQVEADKRRTGIVLASAGATVTKIWETAERTAAFATLAPDERLQAKAPLAARQPDRTFHIMLGEESGYRWTLNGNVHGEHTPLEAKVGERIDYSARHRRSVAGCPAGYGSAG